MRTLRLFVRQSFTEAGPQEVALVQEVLALVRSRDGAPHRLELLTGSEASGAHDFTRSFEKQSGIGFSPRAFREWRLRTLAAADAMLVIRTGLSESGAFEIAHNVYAGAKVPIFFAIWEQARIKTTLLRDLEDLVRIEYVPFARASDLAGPLDAFLAEVAGR